MSTTSVFGSTARLQWRGLVPQLLIVLILPLTVLMVAVPLGSLVLHEQAMRDLVGTRDERAVRSAASALNEQLRHRATALRELLVRTQAGESPQSILGSSDFLMPDFDGGLAFFGPGNALLGSAGPGAQIFTDPAAAPVLQGLLARAGNDPVFSPTFRGAESSTAFTLIAVSDGNGRAAVGAFSPAGLVHQTLQEAFVPGDQASAFVVDAQGQVFYHTGSLPPAAELNNHPGVLEALQGQSGTTYLQASEGEHVAAYSPVSSVGWALVMEERWADIENPLLRTTQAAPLMMIPPFLLALVGLWFVTRQVVRPLQALETRAADLAWGRYAPIEVPVGGIAEIGRLQATLVHMARKVQAAQTSLRDYIGAITTGQEEERRRIARELHDDTLQALIALNQRVQMASLAPQNTGPGSMLTEIQQLLDHTIANLRRLMRALRPIYLEDLGLTAALEVLARETRESAGIAVDFHAKGTSRRLLPQAEMALYRMAQEALSNVVRHSGATQAAVSVAFEPERVQLQVSDNGHGFKVPESPAEFAPQGHFGLLGLHERAELVGAQLVIESTPGQGTQVRVELPTTSLQPEGESQFQPSGAAA